MEVEDVDNDGMEHAFKDQLASKLYNAELWTKKCIDMLDTDEIIRLEAVTHFRRILSLGKLSTFLLLRFFFAD